MKQQKQLPPDFADTILELEMELEHDCTSIESINNLLYLYSVSALPFHFDSHIHKFIDSNTVFSKQWSTTTG